MLKLLRINNIAIILRLEVELGPGLTLFTGETGAGKSILIDSLGLLLGARASADLIRTGEDVAAVEGIVESPTVLSLLERHGIPLDGEEIVLRREMSASGRGKATVNGALVPIAVLREIAPHLAAIHGQHEPQDLLDPETHLALLDHHAGLEGEAAVVAETFGRLREIESALEALRHDRREAERRRETLEYQAAEIEKAQLRPGEQQALRQEKVLQANADRLAALSAEAFGLLYEDEQSIVSRLGQVYRKVEELAGIDPRFGPYLEARTAVRAQLEDLAFFLRDYREGISVSPGRLDEIESRLALVERLERKYGASIEEVLAFATRCREELAALGSPEERERALETERTAAAGRYLEAARALSRKRRAAAKDLERRVQTELGLLAMEKTRFRVGFMPEASLEEAEDRSTWTERGLERAEFLLSPNPGEELRPLARIASGGELSRLLLALKSVASVDAPGKTLVFDEVDAGIGGRAAETVGRRLKQLAATNQVLCVTHLPQIAGFADHHFLVEKKEAGGRTVASVEELEGAARTREIGRMLSGERLTREALQQAEQLLKTGAGA